MVRVSSILELEPALSPLRARGSVALVPTMGALHEGHLSLVRLAGLEAACVVVSIFVNPIQFGPGEDFALYPRSLEKDIALLEREAVDLLFCPQVSEIYPADFSTSVNVAGVSEGGEGAMRPGHFAGVATVVAKLFNAVRPEVAVFGQKDLQQVAVVRRMIRDLNFPVRLLVAPVSREDDGLARSSRNVLFSRAQRQRAAAFPQALSMAARALGEGRALADVRSETRRTLEDCGFGVDYLDLVEPETMAALSEKTGSCALVAAVRIGKVRLIDNILI